MGEMADMLTDQMFDPCEDEYEDLLEDLGPHLWLANDRTQYLIAKMDKHHIINTVRMLQRWVRTGRGNSCAEIVGKKRWDNLVKRLKEVGGRV